MLPDFLVVAPRADAPDRAWPSSATQRITSASARGSPTFGCSKGYLQVAFGAEAVERWSQLPPGLDVHRFGVLAVPKNAFLQPQAIVEDLHDHREEVRTRLIQRRAEADRADWDPSAAPTDLVSHLVARTTRSPARRVRCSPSVEPSSVRASTRSLLVELGVPIDARPHVLGLVDGSGDVNAAAPSLSALVAATVAQAAYRTGQYRVDPAGEPCTVNVVIAKSDAATLGVHGLGVQVVSETGRGDWAYQAFGNPQASETRRAVVRAIGDAVQQSIAHAHTRNPVSPDPVHIVVPDKGTADLSRRSPTPLRE